MHSHRAGRFKVGTEIIEKDRLSRLDRKLPAGEFKKLRLGFSYADL